LFAWRFLRESRELRVSGTHPKASTTTERQAIARVLAAWREPAPRLIWIYTIGIGAFYGTIQTVPLLLTARMGVTEKNIGFFVMYLGGMGVIVRTLLLGRMVDRLGEARLSNLGIVLLAAGLAATGFAHGWTLLAVGFTLMPLGTAFLFPCVTGMLSQVVPSGERGLYMGVQHTFGGVSRVVFPIASGMLMDRFNPGAPFWLSALLVLATLPLALEMAAQRGPTSAAASDARQIVAADVTGEFAADPGIEEKS
jgi:MFS family permease